MFIQHLLNRSFGILYRLANNEINHKARQYKLPVWQISVGMNEARLELLVQKLPIWQN